MIPKHKDLNIGEWKDTSKPYHKKNKQQYLELRLDLINKLVGRIYISPYGCSVRAMFSTENDGTYYSFQEVKTVDELKQLWKELMDELLWQMFKE